VVFERYFVFFMKILVSGLEIPWCVYWPFVFW